MKEKSNVISFRNLKKYYKNNSFIKDCIKYLEEHYNLFEGAQYSYQQFKTILMDLVNKIGSLYNDDKDTDKYHQKGFLGFLKKLKELVIRICDRIISMITSIGFQPIFFLIGLYTTQSVVISLIASSIYWLLCLVIKSLTAKKLNTDKWYEPSNFLKTNTAKSSVSFIESMKTTVVTTAKDIFNWFFIELTDEKATVKFRRRLLLLMTLVVFLLIYIVV